MAYTCCAKPQAAVVCPPEATVQETLAGKEIRRYVYLRTGELLPVVQAAEGDAGGARLGGYEWCERER